MATIEHKNITEANLHEPKGVSTASSGEVYVADGAGSGDWSTLAGLPATPTTGDMVYYNGSAWAKLAAGTAGTVITSNGASTAPSYQASASTSIKAWVAFDGTTTTPTIKSSYNVSSVSRTSTGIYKVNFTSPMANTDYCALATCSYTASFGVFAQAPYGGDISTDYITVCTSTSAAKNNCQYVYLLIVG